MLVGQRQFLDGTPAGFARWRTRVRLNHAAYAMQRGEPLAQAARAGGYATRDGLLKALARETARPLAAVARDPLPSCACSDRIAGAHR